MYLDITFLSACNQSDQKQPLAFLEDDEIWSDQSRAQKQTQDERDNLITEITWKRKPVKRIFENILKWDRGLGDFYSI